MENKPRRRRAKATQENKYEPRPKIGTPKIGRSDNYVTKVGLGNLQVITATPTNGNSNVQSE